MSDPQRTASYLDEITLLRAEVAMWKGIHEGAVAATTADVDRLRAENERLRAALEIMSMMGGYTKLHPDEAAPGVEQNTYSWGVSDGYKEMAEMARTALEEKP